MQIANEIRSQLGGALAMIGAHTFTTNGGENLAFRIKGCRKVNYINVKYNSNSDLYTMEFGKVKKFDYDVVEEVEMVYADQMKGLIKEVIGLETVLF